MGSFRFFRAAAGSLVVSVGALSPVVGLRNRYKHRRWLRSLRFSRPPFSVLALPSSFVCPSRVPSIVVFRSTDSRFGAPQNRYKYRRWLRSLRFRERRWLRSSHCRVTRSPFSALGPSSAVASFVTFSHTAVASFDTLAAIQQPTPRHVQQTTDNGQRTTDNGRKRLSHRCLIYETVARSRVCSGFLDDGQP